MVACAIGGKVFPRFTLQHSPQTRFRAGHGACWGGNVSFADATQRVNSSLVACAGAQPSCLCTPTLARRGSTNMSLRQSAENGLRRIIRTQSLPFAPSLVSISCTACCPCLSLFFHPRPCLCRELCCLLLHTMTRALRGVRFRSETAIGNTCWPHNSSIYVSSGSSKSPYEAEINVACYFQVRKPSTT